MIALIIVGMFGWAVYDYIDKSDKSDTLSTGEGDSVDLHANGEDNNEKGKDDVVGLVAGNIAPDFELETSDGETVKLSDFRGKRVMVNFWATWCPPCRAEMPDIQKFYENKDVVILAVNLIDSRPDEAENVEPFVDDYGLTFPVLLDKRSEVAGLYQIQPIPTNFLIDSSGRIHNVAYGAL